MAMTNCLECKADISDQAASCPRCGAPAPRPARAHNRTDLVLGGVGVVALILALTIGPHFAPASPGAARPPAAVASPTPTPDPAAVATADARLEECRTKLKQASTLDLLHNMTFEGGRPKVWVGETWHRLPIEAKSEFARTAACFFLAGREDRSIAFPVFDGRTGKQIATWSYTRLSVE
jgi:hypothetical protein